jgi:hypothetical protein
VAVSLIIIVTAISNIQDVKLPETKINQLIRETGCKVHKKVISDSSTSSVSYFVDLEVPLVFPQRKRAKR